MTAPLIRTLDGGLATPISAAPRPECCEDCRWNRINCPDAEIEDDTESYADLITLWETDPTAYLVELQDRRLIR